MKIENQKVNDCRVKLAISAGPEETAEDYGKITKLYTQRARIPGFRPGKAPLSVVQRAYGREMQADIEEGADIFIVKPAGPYQDVIRLMRDSFDVPLAAYQVSGEYSLICAAALNGWIDRKAVVLESLIGLKRSGAKMIITYFAVEALREGWIR